MSAQHTPGPWIAQHWPDGAVSVAEASTLGTVALLHETGLPGEPLAVVGLLVTLVAIWVVDHCLAPDPEDEDEDEDEGADHA